VKRGRLVVAAFLLLSACGGDDGPGEVELYDRAPVPGVPDRTAGIDPAMTTMAPDGEYWAELSAWRDAATPTFDFLLTQAFFADACAEVLGSDDCPNDFGTLDEPSATVTVPVADISSVTVVADNRQNFAVTPQELVILAGGQPPSEGAPEGFAYVPFPFLLTVRDGKIVNANQIWLP
jgi:hypothetical protein